MFWGACEDWIECGLAAFWLKSGSFMFWGAIVPMNNLGVLGASLNKKCAKK